MSPDAHHVPAAILLGSVAIGAGLYFGLAARSAVAPMQTAEVASAPRALETAPRFAPEIRPPLAATDRTDAVQAAAPPGMGAGLAGAEKPASPSQRRSVEATLTTAKTASFRPRCWDPLVARSPSPATSRYRVRSVFDAAGRERSRGVSELRGEPSRPDVARCLRELPLDLEAGPLGDVVAVELDLAFP
jgi:hypothetical protein